MASDAKSGESYKPVKSILISQPKPTGSRNSFFALEEKFDIKIDWRQFIHVEPVTEKEFRKNRLRPDDFSAVILTSRQSIDHFFRMCEEMRVKMSAETKYFCISKTVANYLQKFIVYRKRKVFVGKKVIEDLTPAINKHKDKLKFLLPCSNLGALEIVEYLKELKIDFQDVMMYRTLMSDLSDLENVTYDILVFFSPLGIDSLYQNFPDFKQKDTRIAVFGNQTCDALKERGLVANIKAPSKESPSMTMALEQYLKLANSK